MAVITQNLLFEIHVSNYTNTADLRSCLQFSMATLLLAHLCSISFTSIYYRQMHYGFISISQNIHIAALLYADDLVLVASCEDDLQYSIPNLYTVCEKYEMEIQ